MESAWYDKHLLNFAHTPWFCICVKSVYAIAFKARKWKWEILNTQVQKFPLTIQNSPVMVLVDERYWTQTMERLCKWATRFYINSCIEKDTFVWGKSSNSNKMQHQVPRHKLGSKDMACDMDMI